jgi:hypothetical protein
MAQASESAPEARAHERAKSYTGLMWHTGAFLGINAFFWLLDVIRGANGVQWTYWITLFWGLALVYPVVAYVVGGSGLEERQYQKALAVEQKQREP